MSSNRLINIIIVVLVVNIATSCVADLDPSAANSAGGILAIIGEYLLAILSLLVVFLFHIARIFGAFAIVVSTCALFSDTELLGTNIPPLMSLSLGIFLIAISFFKLKIHEPEVYIHKNFHRRNAVIIEKSSMWWQELLLGVISGIIVQILFA